MKGDDVASTGVLANGNVAYSITKKIYYDETVFLYVKSIRIRSNVTWKTERPLRFEYLHPSRLSMSISWGKRF